MTYNLNLNKTQQYCYKSINTIGTQIRGLAGKKAIQLHNNQLERVVNVTSRCQSIVLI